MCIYKQSQESTHLSTFLQRDLCGRLSVPQNAYGRRLVHVLLENSEGLKENLTEKLASQGFTLSFYTTGIGPRHRHSDEKSHRRKERNIHPRR